MSAYLTLDNARFAFLTIWVENKPAAVVAGGHAECLHSDEFNVSYQLAWVIGMTAALSILHFR